MEVEAIAPAPNTEGQCPAMPTHAAPTPVAPDEPVSAASAVPSSTMPAAPTRTAPVAPSPAAPGRPAPAADAAPADVASFDDERIDARTELLFGRPALERLADSVVLVFGLGGVGSSCVEALARGGIGGLFLVDRDVVEASNINRQALAFHSTVGRAKTDVMRAMVADINPAVRVEARQAYVARDGAGAFFDEALAAFGRIDYVLDCIDTMAQKVAIAQQAQARGLRHLSSMGAAHRLHPEMLRFADLSETTVCPMCIAMRRMARKAGLEHMDVLYTPERPVNVARWERAEDGSVRKPPLGTASFFPPIMGQMMAGKVICELTGIEGAAPDRQDQQGRQAAATRRR